MTDSFFRPRIIQFAWVVPDIEIAARGWYASLGIGPFLVNRELGLDQPRYRGAPTSTRFSTAVAQSGDIQIELIEQHDNSHSAYRDTVANGTIGFHHVAFITDDFDTALAHYTAQGFAVASDGRFGDMRYAYVDTAATIGHMIEIIEEKPALLSFFGAVRSAANRWDGDPATLFRQL